MNPEKDTVLNAMILEKKGADLIKIPLDQIDHVDVFARNAKGRVWGAAIGAVVDAGALLILLSNFSFDLGSFCPYVYSYDGESYRLEAEMCSGAYYKGAECTDWAVLRYLKPTNGVYTLKLANELDETDFIDRLSLLLFDLSEERHICATEEGDFFAVADLQAPRSANTSDGADQKMALQYKDDAFWLSNPFIHDPECDANRIDGLELCFEKPANAASAVLLLNLRNTPWAALQQQVLLDMYGQERYAQLDTDTVAQHILSAASVRENLLHFSVWDGEQWQETGVVNFVGPAVDREVAKEINLKHLKSDVLRVRLECPAGYWMLNSVQASFSYTRINPSSELFPSSATNQNGQDVGNLLRESDGQYLSMPAGKGRLNLTFTAPPQASGTMRTAMVRCSGYYAPQMTTKGTADDRLLAQLLHEPGAYRRWRQQQLGLQTQVAIREHSQKR